MTDAITQGLSYTVTPDLFGETRINLNGLTVEQVDAMLGAVDTTLASTSYHQEALEPVVIVLHDALKDLANGSESKP